MPRHTAGPGAGSGIFSEEDEEQKRIFDIIRKSKTPNRSITQGEFDAAETQQRQREATEQRAFDAADAAEERRLLTPVFSDKELKASIFDDEQRQGLLSQGKDIEQEKERRMLLADLKAAPGAQGDSKAMLAAGGEGSADSEKKGLFGNMDEDTVIAMAGIVENMLKRQRNAELVSAALQAEPFQPGISKRVAQLSEAQPTGQAFVPAITRIRTLAKAREERDRLHNFREKILERMFKEPGGQTVG